MVPPDPPSNGPPSDDPPSDGPPPDDPRSDGSQADGPEFGDGGRPESGWTRLDGDSDGQGARAPTAPPGDRESTAGPAEEAPDGEPSSADGSLTDPGTILRKLLAVGTAFGLGVLGFAIGVPLILLASLVLFGLGIDSPAAGIVVSLVCLQGIAFPTVAGGYLAFRYGLDSVLDRESWGNFVRIGVPSLGDVGWTVLGLFATLGLMFASLVLVSLLNAPTAQRSDSEVLFSNPELLLLLIPASFLLIGPGEELLFRGIIQDRLREAFGPVAAIVLASAAFAPLHVFALSGGLQAIATTIGVLFVPSLVFGATYETTDNLLVPVLIHGAYDAVIFGGSYLLVTLG